MIDDKKIEEAATNYAQDGYNNYDDNIQSIIEEAFKSGATWMQEKFLKNLWHPASEEPKGKVPLLCHREHKFLSFMVDELSDFEDWGTFIYDFDITEWIYLDDLFPKEGGKQ